MSWPAIRIRQFEKASYAPQAIAYISISIYLISVLSSGIRPFFSCLNFGRILRRLPGKLRVSPRRRIRLVARWPLAGRGLQRIDHLSQNDLGKVAAPDHDGELDIHPFHFRGGEKLRPYWILRIPEGLISQERQRSIIPTSSVVLVFLPLLTAVIVVPCKSRRQIQLSDQGFFIEVVLSCGRP